MKTRAFISIILMLILINGSAIWAQESKIIKGRVTTFGVIPLNNVEISTSKSKEVAHSDYTGSFTINCIDKDVIKVTASGFDIKKVKAKKLDSLIIDLVYSNTELSFNDAIENGHISRAVLEQAIAKYPLKGEKDYSRYNSIYELIKNEIYNVNVNGTTITTMKPTSYSSSQEVPCAVDGVILMDISSIIPSEVKSIRYVDGPEASQYGLRGANGVIEITMK